MRRIAGATWILAAVLLAVAIAPGCGVKNAPIPPEAARPQQILDLEAIPERRGIQLTWSRPEQYASGKSMNDLGGFTVMRADGQAQYQPIVEVPVTDRERFQVAARFTYTDNTAAPNHFYRYEVVSHTTDGYKSLPSNEAALSYVRPRPALPAPLGTPAPPENPAPAPPAALMITPHLRAAPPPPLPPVP
jgi:hypothetical protein